MSIRKRQTTSTFCERVDEALSNAPVRRALKIGVGNLQTKRSKAVAAFPQMADFCARARQIRARTLQRLDAYLSQFAEQVEAAGGHVHRAADAAEANALVLEIARAHDARRVVKSKSMVTEEIRLNHALQRAGIEVVESDLGEFIIQLAEERPSHIVAPVMHKTRREVGEVFHRKLGVPFTDDPIALNDIARAHLRQIFLTADVGISGVNFGVAESGSLCIITNEGNGRFTTTAPRVHVALMGMEKVVPTLDDLQVLLNVLARSATGQKLTVYTNIITGPRRPGDPDGPDELHVIILDNGRRRTLASGAAEILYCIRCGACMNHCPVYQEIGGHAYGSVYPGPMGSVLTPSLWGLAGWADLPHASTLCGACRDVCPVGIDLPALLLKLRVAGAQAESPPRWLRWGLRLYRFAAERPALFRLGMRLAALVTRPLAKGGALQNLPGPLRGWTAHRTFPPFAARPFHRQWAKRSISNRGEGGEKRVQP